VRNNPDPAGEEHAMTKTITDTTRRRLDIQGFDGASTESLAEVAPWFRLALGLCTAIAAIGTALASPIVLLALVPIAFLGTLLPVHPFDLIYNLGIRHLRGTAPIPHRGAPTRFACGVGTMWLLVTSWAFWSDHSVAGYILGFSLAALGSLVSTTDICIPSMIYRAIFGPPAHRVRVPGTP
jgi:Domain of unknown function (DUF4395)